MLCLDGEDLYDKFLFSKLSEIQSSHYFYCSNYRNHASRGSSPAVVDMIGICTNPYYIAFLFFHYSIVLFVGSFSR